MTVALSRFELRVREGRSHSILIDGSTVKQRSPVRPQDALIAMLCEVPRVLRARLSESGSVKTFMITLLVNLMILMQLKWAASTTSRGVARERQNRNGKSSQTEAVFI